MSKEKNEREKVEEILESAENMRREAEAVLAGNGVVGVRAYLNTKERAEIKRLRTYLKQMDEENSHLRERVETLEHLELLANPKPIKVSKRRGKRRKSAILLSSDTHWMENVDPDSINGFNEHNSEIGRDRIRSINSQAVQEMKREAKVSDLQSVVLWYGGDDMVNGDMHHGFLSRFVDHEPLEEMGLTYKMRYEETSFLAERVPSDQVSVICSVSNHGRDTEKMQLGLASERSYDISVCKRLASEFPELNWDIANTYYSTIDLGSYRVMFHHGHAKGASIRRAAAGVGIPRWKWITDMQSVYGFQLWCQGHYHTAGALLSSSLAHIQNGCTVGANGYSIDSGFPPEPPSQQLIFIDHEVNQVDRVVTIYA